jgi:hypothetical protein
MSYQPPFDGNWLSGQRESSEFFSARSWRY